ncbi:MAG: hypothetical protein E7538_04550 [Ruminococcaceae bacterium]|nr:hypothetical protein [Oscillospiraceae bacterium]
MTKVKEKLYEHRFALIFFGILLACSIIDFQNVYSGIDTGLTYSIYAVDFSFGFCTRLLPGAVFNFLFNDISVNKVCFYMIALLIFCLISVSKFAEDFIDRFNKENRKQGIVIALFLVLTFFICFSAGDFLDILDFHWIIGAVIFLLLLRKNATCLVMPVLFFCVVMCHYGSMICYIPMFVIILMLKAVYSKEKKEKVFLISIIGVSLISAIALFAYMLMFELENIKFSLEEFNAILSSKGVTDFEYYNFPFFRETADLSKLTDNGDLVPLVQVDLSQPKIIVMIQTVINQIQVHIALWNHSDIIFYALTFVPLVAFAFYVLIRSLKNEKGARIRSLLYLAVMILIFFTVISGLFMSTDTLRWCSHGIIVFSTAFGYVIHNDVEIKEKVCCSLAKISDSFIYGYLLIYVSYLFVFI